MLVFKCIVLFCMAAATNAKLPDYIKPCRIDDNECVATSAKIALPELVKGDPESGVPRMDPMHVDHLNDNIGGLSLDFSNVVIEGLRNCEIKKIVRTKRLVLELDLLCSVTAFGDYKTNGTGLGLAIEGDGKFDVKIPKILLSVSANFKIFEKEGKEHYKIATFDFKYDPQEKVTYNFENLFNGDETRAAPAKQLMNDSWKEIFSTFGGGIVKQILTDFSKALNKFFYHHPCEELEIA